jgi:hypothetical protein
VVGLTRLIRSGLRKPDEIVPYLRFQRQCLRYERRARRQPDQFDLIRAFAARDRFLLIVLDACRFDTFADQWTDYLDGELECVTSVAGNTPNYVNSTWPDSYDLTYVSANPQISDRAQELHGFDYRPTAHFETVVDVWADYWDPSTGTTPPEPVTAIALDRIEAGDRRLVVHYMQPHSPFIGGETELEAHRLEADDERISRAREDRGHWREVADGRDPLDIQESGRIQPTEHLQEMFEAGEIGPEDIWPAYRSNLNRVLAAVRDLVIRVDSSIPVVVTADHGEMIGDVPWYGFGHPHTMHPSVRDVPWLEVDGRMQGTADQTYEATMEADRDEGLGVRDRLEQLGYLG